jgi:hypothetical protein
MSSTIGDQSELAVAVTPTVVSRLQPDGPVAAPIPEPNVLWTVLTTLFFGIFGAIAAAIQSSKASTLGYNPAKPWIAFGITLLAGIALEVMAVLTFLGVIIVGSSSAGLPSLNTDGSLVVYLLVIGVGLLVFSFAIADTGHATTAHSSAQGPSDAADSVSDSPTVDPTKAWVSPSLLFTVLKTVFFRSNADKRALYRNEVTQHHHRDLLSRKPGMPDWDCWPNARPRTPRSATSETLHTTYLRHVTQSWMTDTSAGRPGFTMPDHDLSQLVLTPFVPLLGLGVGPVFEAAMPIGQTAQSSS